jgi:hypothetical protein
MLKSSCMPQSETGLLTSSVRTTFDPYEYGKSVRAAEVKAFVTTRGEFAARRTRIDLHHLWMQRCDTSLPHITHFTADGHRSIIFFPPEIDQAGEVWGGSELSPGKFAWLSLGAEFHRKVPADNSWAAMSLTPEDLAIAAQALTGRQLAAPELTRVIRPKPSLMSRLMNLHKAAINLATTAPDILAHPEVAKAMEEELVRTMVACLTEAGKGKSDRSFRSGLAVMRRFEQRLEAHEDEPLYVSEICAQIAVTDRMLRRCCQEHLA